MASETVNPKTYTGYGGESNQEVITSKTAINADQLLDPSKVSAAVKVIKDTVDECMKNTGNELEGLTKDTDKAVVAKGASMSDTLTQTADYLYDIPEQVDAALDGLVEAAVDARNALQTEINKQVKDMVSSTAGVTHVEES